MGLFWVQFKNISTTKDSFGHGRYLNAGSPHESDDEVFLGLRLEADHVHAHLAAVVAAGEPVPPGVPQDSLVAGPRHPVALAVEVEVSDYEKSSFSNFCKGSFRNDWKLQSGAFSAISDIHTKSQFCVLLKCSEFGTNEIWWSLVCYI